MRTVPYRTYTAADGRTIRLAVDSDFWATDISGEDAAGIIGQVYAAEAKAREESKPAHVVKPAEPRPDSFIEREEGFPFAPPVNVACTLTLSVKYAPKYEDTVQEALAMLRTVGLVTVF